MVDEAVTGIGCFLLSTSILHFFLGERCQGSLRQHCRTNLLLFLLSHEMQQSIPDLQQNSIQLKRMLFNDTYQGFCEMFAIPVANSLNGNHDCGGGNGAWLLDCEVIISNGIFCVKCHLLMEKVQRARLDLGVRVLRKHQRKNSIRHLQAGWRMHSPRQGMQYLQFHTLDIL